MRFKAAGRRDVEPYFGNYAKLPDWYLVPGWLDGREVLAVFSPPGAARPTYFIELSWQDDRVSAIRDFYYVRYIAQEAQIEFG